PRPQSPHIPRPHEVRVLLEEQLEAMPKPTIEPVREALVLDALDGPLTEAVDVDGHRDVRAPLEPPHDHALGEAVHEQQLLGEAQPADEADAPEGDRVDLVRIAPADAPA